MLTSWHFLSCKQKNYKSVMQIKLKKTYLSIKSFQVSRVFRRRSKCFSLWHLNYTKIILPILFFLLIRTLTKDKPTQYFEVFLTIKLYRIYLSQIDEICFHTTHDACKGILKSLQNQNKYARSNCCSYCACAPSNYG